MRILLLIIIFTVGVAATTAQAKKEKIETSKPSDSDYIEQNCPAWGMLIAAIRNDVTSAKRLINLIKPGEYATPQGFYNEKNPCSEHQSNYFVGVKGFFYIDNFFKGEESLYNNFDDFDFTISQHFTSYMNPLAFAAVSGSLEIAKMLLDKGYNPTTYASYKQGAYPVGSPLLLAALNNQKEMVQLLLKYGANPNYIDKRGNGVATVELPLCAALSTENEPLTKLLAPLTNRQNLSYAISCIRNLDQARYLKTLGVRGIKKETALQRVINNHPKDAEITDLVRFLIDDLGVDPESSNYSYENRYTDSPSGSCQWTSLMTASYQASDATFEYLLQKTSQKAATERAGCSSLQFPPSVIDLLIPFSGLYEENKVRRIESVLQRYPDTKLFEGKVVSPISLAILSGHDNIVKTLVEKGFNKDFNNKLDQPIFRDKQFIPAGYTPLMLALALDNEEIFTYLLQAGVDVNILTAKNESALTIAMTKEDRSYLDALMASKKLNQRSLNAQDKTTGQTPLIKAIVTDNNEIFTYLLQAGVDVNILTAENESALTFAMTKEDRSYLDALMASNKLNQRSLDARNNKEWKTPLVRAVIAGNIELVNQLLKLGADLSLQDKEGYTALKYAMKMQREDIVRLLIYSGAK